MKLKTNLKAGQNNLVQNNAVLISGFGGPVVNAPTTGIINA
jgi:hypothetical protein